MDKKSKKTELLHAIREEVFSLTSSPLYKYRTSNNYFPVLGEGNHNAKIFFIGEAPGKNEAISGRPFCGSAGKILDELLTSIKIKRKDVYITNIVKDRPPNNRDPKPKEIEVYGLFLDRQLEIIKPSIIVTLGRFSMSYVMKKYNLAEKLRPISQLHGRVFETKAPFGKIKIVIMYHPAAALYGTTIKDIMKKDFKVLKKI